MMQLCSIPKFDLLIVTAYFHPYYMFFALRAYQERFMGWSYLSVQSIPLENQWMDLNEIYMETVLFCTTLKPYFQISYEWL